MSELTIELKDVSKTYQFGFLGGVRALRSLTRHLELKGISKTVHAVRSLTLQVPRGEIYGFLGPNGAGKTTTLKMLMGLVKPSGGNGVILNKALGDRAARARIGYLPEQPYFYEHLTPAEFLHFYGALYGLSHRALNTRVEELISMVGLDHARKRTLRKFSKGMVQRLGLAQTLINDPDLVILDEPMSGLDPMGRKTVRDLIYGLKEKGKTVFFSSHILQDVEMVCDRVGLIQNGALIREGTLNELLDGENEQKEVVVRGAPLALTQFSSDMNIEMKIQGNRSVFLVDDDTALHRVLTSLVDRGLRVQEISPSKKTLEQLFVELTDTEEGKE